MLPILCISLCATRSTLNKLEIPSSCALVYTLLCASTFVGWTPIPDLHCYRQFFHMSLTLISIVNKDILPFVKYFMHYSSPTIYLCWNGEACWNKCFIHSSAEHFSSKIPIFRQKCFRNRCFMTSFFVSLSSILFASREILIKNQF